MTNRLYATVLAAFSRGAAAARVLSAKDDSKGASAKCEKAANQKVTYPRIAFRQNAFIGG